MVGTCLDLTVERQPLRTGAMVRASQLGASVKCRKRPLTVAKRPAGVKMIGDEPTGSPVLSQGVWCSFALCAHHWQTGARVYRKA